MDPLRELANTRQVPGEPQRRWFSSRNLDLIVWLGEDEAPVGFQLCYDKLAAERALTWREGRGYSHMSVDDGEEAPGAHKRTPILRADGYFDRERVRSLFMVAAADIPQGVRNYVTAALDRYPEAP